MMSVSAPSTTPGMSEVLRNIFFKKSDLERSSGLSSYPDSRAKACSISESPKHPQPLQDLALSAHFLMTRHSFPPAAEFAQPHPTESITQIHQKRLS